MLKTAVLIHIFVETMIHYSSKEQHLFEIKITFTFKQVNAFLLKEYISG